MSPQRSARSKGQKATLASLAEAVGVSRTTVSNAYNNPSHLSEETRARILAAAEKMGYSGPDPAARSLRTGRADAIGVLFTDKLTYAFEDRASVDFLAGLAESCQSLDSSLVLIPAGPGKVQSGVNLVAQAAVDGFVVYSVASDDPTLEVIASRNLPTVICDQPSEAPILDQASFVGIDDRACIRAGIENLVEHGHSKIGILCIRLDRATHSGFVSPERLEAAHMHVQRGRVQGMLDVLREKGLTSDATPPVAPPTGSPSQVVRIEGVPVVECYINDTQGTREAAELLLDSCPDLTAVACTTDSLALAVMEYAKNHGLSVPGDLSVTGFDGIDAALRMGITTVFQPNKLKGRTAGSVLRTLIDAKDDPAPPTRTPLTTRFIPGSTVAAPRG